MRKLSLLCFLLGSLLTIQSLQAQLDSLLNALPTTPPDTNRVQLYQEIAYTYLYSDRKLAQAYTDSATQLSQELNFGMGVRHSMYLSVAIANFNGELERAETLGLATLEVAREANDLATQARVLNTLCQVYTAQFRLEEALEAITECTALCRQSGDKAREAVATYTTATVYQYLNELEIAKSYLHKASSLFEELGDTFRQGIALQGLAVLSYGAEAFEYAQQSYNILLSTDDVMGVGMALWTMGDAQQEMGQAQAALPHYQEALAIFKEIDYPEGTGNVQVNIGSILAKSQAYRQAPPYLQAAEEIARAVPYDDVLRATFRGWAYYYAQIGDAEASIAYMDSARIISDTLYNRERSEALLEAETRLKTKEKEAALFESELAREKQNSLINTLIMIGGLVIAGLVILFFVLRDRQRRQRQATLLDLELERQKALQLKELDQLKSNFFANISHEFRTPLTVILGPLREMREGTFQGNFKQYYDIMLRSAKRLQELINQLLDLSKLESSKMESHPRVGDIHLFSRQVGGALESWAFQQSITYTISVDKEPLWLVFDHDQLEKILNNLLSNAIKFTPEGGEVVLRLTTENREDQYWLQYEVVDSGPGIPPAELEHIFERFYQSTQQIEGHASSGIGLALTKELVDFQNGTIFADNRPGGGAVFCVELVYPQASAPEELEMAPEMPQHQEATASSPTPATKALPNSLDAPIVLVVEDNTDVRQYIKDQLRSSFQIMEASNGAIGMEMAQQHIPDLIVSDVMMPEVDGYALVQRLRADERTSHIPVIMLTAKAEQHDKLEGLATGVDSYLVKPFDPAELRLRTQKLIEQRRLLQERYSREHLFPIPIEEQPSMDEQFLQRFRGLILEQLDDEQLSVEVLSSQMNLSRSQLHRKLKALTGFSPNVWVRKIRLQKARQLLEQKSGTVTEVAFQVGFSNMSYFAKCFREEFGLAPSDL